MAVARSLFVGISCAALALAALTLPGAARADSNGVPPVEGTWSGKLTDVYWDQTSAGSLRPRQKFKSNVDVTIAQAVDQLTITINFVDPFPVNSGAFVSQLVLTGYGGNFHVSGAMSAGPSVTLSGEVNKKGTSLQLDGIAASTEFTHQLSIKLKKQSP